MLIVRLTGPQDGPPRECARVLRPRPRLCPTCGHAPCRWIGWQIGAHVDEPARCVRRDDRVHCRARGNGPCTVFARIDRRAEGESKGG
jgi:hypothetical protein